MLISILWNQQRLELTDPIKKETVHNMNGCQESFSVESVFQAFPAQNKSLTSVRAAWGRPFQYLDPRPNITCLRLRQIDRIISCPKLVCVLYSTQSFDNEGVIFDTQSFIGIVDIMISKVNIRIFFTMSGICCIMNGQHGYCIHLA